MPLKIRELSPEVLAIARRDLHEDPDRREADVDYIREWLTTQPHITARPDDQMIVTFLRVCKFNLEKTKQKIDNYYTLRTALPYCFNNRSPKNEEIRELLELGSFLLLPETDPEGHRVFLARGGLTDCSKHKMDDMMKLIFMLADMLVHEDDAAIVGGVVVVMDLKAFTLAHSRQYLATVIKNKIFNIQKSYPIRPQGLNYINYSLTFKLFLNMLKGYMHHTKLYKRLFLHGDKMESLYQNVPQALLPAEYGGNAGTIKELNDQLMKKLDSYSAWFEVDAANGVDESKRPRQQGIFGQMMGYFK